MSTDLTLIPHVSRDNAVCKRSLEDFSPEILMIIFESCAVQREGSDTFSSWNETFKRLLLLSRSLNAIVTPIYYRKIIVQPRLLLDTTHYQAALRNIQTHSRHIKINSPLASRHVRVDSPEKWEVVAKLVTGCRRLQDFTWRCHSRNCSDPIPTVISEAIGSKDPALRLHFDRLNVPLSIEVNAKLCASIPPSNLVSIVVGHSDSVRGRSDMSSSSNPLNELLLQSQKLETLTMGSIYWSSFPSVGRLSPIRALSLSNCNWPDSKKTVNAFWDFSRLEDLEMNYMKFSDFLKTVSDNGLTSLRSLRIWTNDQLEENPLRYDHSSGLDSALLANLLENVQRLEVLEIPRLVRSSSIAKSTSLRVLKVRDFSEFEDNPAVVDPFPAFTLHDLATIQNSCPWISDLDIGFNDDKEILRTIAKFRYLRTLTLRTYLVCDQLPDMVDGIDQDRETSEQNLMYLHSHKQSSSLSRAIFVRVERQKSGHNRGWGTDSKKIKKREFSFSFNGPLRSMIEIRLVGCQTNIYEYKYPHL